MDEVKVQTMMFPGPSMKVGATVSILKHLEGAPRDENENGPAERTRDTIAYGVPSLNVLKSCSPCFSALVT